MWDARSISSLDNAGVSLYTRFVASYSNTNVSTESGNGGIKYLEIRAAIQDYPSAICAV